MLQGGNPLTVGVGIIIEVIRKNNSDYDPDGVNSPSTIPTTYDPIYLGTLLRIFGQHITDFMALVRSSKHTVNDGGEVKKVEREDLVSPWGAKVEPLGFDRFKTCELMAELLHCSNMRFLNQAGADEYIYHRDTERERLVREGAFNIHGEGYSGVDFNDSSADFVNGSSMLGSGSPEDAKALEVTNASEEDGFENVNAGDARGQEAQVVEGPEKGDKSNSGGDDLQASASSVAPTEPSDPTSPTASGITDQVGEIKLEEREKGSGEAPAEGQNLPVSDPQEPNPSGEPASVAISSHPEDVPAPLFAAKQQTEPSAGESEHTTEKTQDTPSEGVQEQKLHPDVQVDVNGQPVVGDYLKIMFVENRVVPTILV